MSIVSEKVHRLDTPLFDSHCLDLRPVGDIALETYYNFIDNAFIYIAA